MHDFGTYHSVEQRKLRRVSTFAQTQQGHRCLRTQSMDVDEDSV